MSSLLNMATIVWVLGGLVLLVNLLTQVIKQITYDKIPSSLLAVILSLVITLLAFFAYCAVESITIYWYYIVAAVIVGFLVAYAAMFGFDTLKEKILEWYASKDSDDDDTDTTSTTTTEVSDITADTTDSDTTTEATTEETTESLSEEEKTTTTESTESTDTTDTTTTTAETTTTETPVSDSIAAMLAALS